MGDEKTMVKFHIVSSGPSPHPHGNHHISETDRNEWNEKHPKMVWDLSKDWQMGGIISSDPLFPSCPHKRMKPGNAARRPKPE